MRINYKVTVGYDNIVGSHNQNCWRISRTSYIDNETELLTVSGMGKWFHNRRTGECTRTVRTSYRLAILEQNLNEHRIQIDSIRPVYYN